MSETVSVNIDTTAAREAGEELETMIREELAPAAAELEEVFRVMARSIEDELEKAARKGAFSMKTMVQEILNDLAKLAAEKIIREPLQNALSGLFEGVIGGVAGNITGTRSGTAAERPVTINMVLPAGTPSPGQSSLSETQLAATLQRALARGTRNS